MNDLHWPGRLRWGLGTHEQLGPLVLGQRPLALFEPALLGPHDRGRVRTVLARAQVEAVELDLYESQPDWGRQIRDFTRSSRATVLIVLGSARLLLETRAVAARLEEEGQGPGLIELPLAPFPWMARPEGLYTAGGPGRYEFRPFRPSVRWQVLADPSLGAAPGARVQADRWLEGLWLSALAWGHPQAGLMGQSLARGAFETFQALMTKPLEPATLAARTRAWDAWALCALAWGLLPREPEPVLAQILGPVTGLEGASAAGLLWANWLQAEGQSLPEAALLAPNGRPWQAWLSAEGLMPSWRDLGVVETERRFLAELAARLAGRGETPEAVPAWLRACL